jgi:hypothetical protein
MTVAIWTRAAATSASLVSFAGRKLHVTGEQRRREFMVALCQHFIDRAKVQLLRERELLLQDLAPPIELMGHAIEFNELPRRGLRLIPAGKLFAVHAEKLQFIRH